MNPMKKVRAVLSRIGLLDPRPHEALNKLALEQESAEDKPRVEVQIEDAGERIKDFREVEKGFSEEEAYNEAIRCLRCDLEKEENAI